MDRAKVKLAANTAADGGEAGFLKLSMLGGLSQFGAYVDTLGPGSESSERHWHDCEDEFLYMLDGVASLHDDDGLQDLSPGDAVCWRHGDRNAHHMINRGTAPCSYLIVGSRVAGDRCHYPDSGSVQVNGATTWQVLAADGAVLRAGNLPPELLNLPPPWGKASDGSNVPRVQRPAGRVWVDEVELAHPVLGTGLGPYRACVLGDAGGLSQFGVHLECLPPGSLSSFRHWHEGEDEMVLVLSGEVMLIEDDEVLLGPGEVACWPAGHGPGHCLENRGTSEPCYLVIGSRHDRDVIHYPDHDLVAHKNGKARAWFHADGQPRSR